MVRKIVHLRWKQRLGPVEISDRLSMPASTVYAAASRRIGLVMLEFAVLLLAIGRVIRPAWLFDRLMAITDRDQTDQPRAAAPELDPRWAGKAAG